MKPKPKPKNSAYKLILHWHCCYYFSKCSIQFGKTATEKLQKNIIHLENIKGVNDLSPSQQ